MGDVGIPGREVFKHPSPEFKHHMYVCVEGVLPLVNHLVLRDHLRSHSKDREKYSDLKKRLAGQYKDDVEAYVDGKTDFILSILKQYDLGGRELDETEAVNKMPAPSSLNQL